MAFSFGLCLGQSREVREPGSASVSSSHDEHGDLVPPREARCHTSQEYMVRTVTPPTHDDDVIGFFKPRTSEAPPQGGRKARRSLARGEVAFAVRIKVSLCLLVVLGQE